MSDIQGSPEFNALSDQEQARYRKVARSVVQHVQRYAVPLCFAPPLSIGGKVNGATGCVLHLESAGWFMVTANHVLSEYEMRRTGERLNWQFGHLPPFDPIPRIAWRDAARDIVLLQLSEQEVAVACDSTSLTFSAVAGWPPVAPAVGQVVVMAGFPKILREVGSTQIEAGPYAAMFRVTSIGDGYFYCQIEQKELISFGEEPLPPPAGDLGGLSGGPVAMMTNLAYPLIGIVTEHLQQYKILRIATLEGIYESDFRKPIL
jgi:hypothetical protein